LCSLQYKRVAVYSEGESSDNIEMNLSGMKQISGEDKINARQLYGKPFEFKAICKLHFLTNFLLGLAEEKAIVARTNYMFLDTVFSHNPKAGELAIDNIFTEQL